jgi:prepilin-type N-terminal cleavage/methylation domain-containing protein
MNSLKTESRLNAGFTLTELIIVIAIISILASMAIPMYIKYQNKSKISSFALPIVSQPYGPNNTKVRIESLYVSEKNVKKYCIFKNFSL